MTLAVPTPRHGISHRLAALAWRKPWLGLGALLGPPLAWFLLVYLAALAVLFVSAFWSVDGFSGQVDRSFTLANLQELITSRIYRAIALRTIGMAAIVTVVDAVIAFPFAYFMARIAGPRLKVALFTLVMLPLWSSYLARVYAWRLILAHDGALNWALKAVGLRAADIGYSLPAMGIVFCYVWLPFMIAPLFTALDRIPQALFEASADLGARGWRTLVKVVLPLGLPGLVAGSIFTFSLTLGDYITPVLVGGRNADFIGNVVYANVGIANNVPFAAAFALVPLIVMALYLAGARRLGAFETL